MVWDISRFLKARMYRPVVCKTISRFIIEWTVIQCRKVQIYIAVNRE